MFRTHLARQERACCSSTRRRSEVTMWMRNTYIPLDMVFIRADGACIASRRAPSRCREDIIASRGNVAACLELAGGAAERLGLKPGDRVEHRFFQAAGKAPKK